MPDYEIRRATTATRRDGRRSLSAYEPLARGAKQLGESQGHPIRSAQPRGALQMGRHAPRAGSHGTAHAGDSNAGIALALVYPLVRCVQCILGRPAKAGGKGENMKQRKPSIQSLETVTLEEAQAYLAFARGDELEGAHALAWDRNRLDGSVSAPDDAEVHHALFLLCRALGKVAPSFDQMRVELRRRAAA
jgi:hypothetical protein